MTTHYEVATSALVLAKCPLLAETASQIGDVQVRNMGTIGGSSAHNDPSADYPAALQALEAKLVLKGAKKERTVSAADFFIDTFTTALEEGELIREVIVPFDSAGSSYQKCVQPASGFAIVGVAVRLKKSGGKLSDVRIGVTGLSNSSFRAKAAEKALEGKAGTEEEIKAAAAVVAQGADANSDLHASAEYRTHLTSVYAARAIKAAIAKA
jgi:carbon-monoxide dehydrogenase medium subunit